MKNFIFKSTNADLQKMFSILETIQKNVVYMTYRVDMILKLVKAKENDSNLQKQVDQFFEEDTEHIPEVDNDDTQSSL